MGAYPPRRCGISYTCLLFYMYMHTCKLNHHVGSYTHSVTSLKFTFREFHMYIDSKHAQAGSFLKGLECLESYGAPFVHYSIVKNIVNGEKY